ncbi:MAG: ABC transporter substrate-binding protein [Oscillibacter sp.]|nr:ABC transporter substrate-binding protein [Oscillibacter sp.]
MKPNTLKKLLSAALSLALTLSLCACGGSSSGGSASAAPAQSGAGIESSASGSETEVVTYKVGICNYVDDASLNQIVENIQARLAQIGAENNVSFAISYDNCNADAAVLSQIIANFIADDVDLMVGVATPVAIAMQAETEENRIPVIFSAVSDPEGAQLVASNDAPGANLTGTSDYLDTNAVMDLIFAADPDAHKIGLLYDQGQDSSTAPIAHAREYLESKGVEVVERTGTTTDEVMLAAQALVADGVDAVFTPTDNTIMTAELSIYEIFADAGIPHYTGADSFALNGAFLGYGVDYANLGVETANMVADVLLNGADPAVTPVKTFDNGTATVNTEICEALGLDFAAIEAAFSPLCTKVATITTAESFGDIAG